MRDIRHEAPGIGAYKLYLMLKELYPDEMRGRDWFYGLMHESHLMLKPGKRRHTTSSNHPYRKYKNMIKGLTVNRINQLWVADITYIDKSHTLFAMNIARRSKRRGIILCEGYMDVIAMHQAGFDNAAASLGTALTMGHATIVKRYTDEVYLAYDSDGAGRKRLHRARHGARLRLYRQILPPLLDGSFRAENRSRGGKYRS